jgi:hypothetical protein
MAQVSKINGIPVVDTSVTGFTYNDINEFTISKNDGSVYTATINTLSGITYYGDGSNLTGINTDNFVTGATFNSNQFILTRNDSEQVLLLSGGTNITLTNPNGNQINIESSGGGSFTSFNVSGDTGQETIEDSNTLLLYGGQAIKTSVIATDKVTIDLDITGTTAEGSPTTGDKILIWDASSATHKNVDWSDLPGVGGGEVNTLSSVGSGNDLFYQKSGSDLQIRTLVAGTNVTITSGATELTINSSGGGGGGSSRITGSTQTTNADVTTGDTINTLTDNATNIVEVYVKAYESGAAEYGVWKRTLTVTSVSGTVVIREENADVDKTSTGLNANSLDFEVSGGNINILVTGIAATTIDWSFAYEIIL